MIDSMTLEISSLSIFIMIAIACVVVALIVMNIIKYRGRKNFENNNVFSKCEETVWQFRNCGYIHVGNSAPELCPACLHPQAHFEVKKENY
jgi:rubrerythrin